jgi:putative phosphoribosyl transferase
MISGNKPSSGPDGHKVSVDTPEVALAGILTIPTGANGIVIFAHGSGSSRHSPRNLYVAEVLHSRQIATLLFDLLTAEEDDIDRLTAEFRFDIPLLARRLIGATEWVERHPEAGRLPIGYFGASTGAAAALVAAAELDNRVKAVVSRGGRPDLAGGVLGLVSSPTLLIVGGNDSLVVDMNRGALDRLGCRESKVVIIPGATHLFEEPGALKEVALVAADWFGEHLAPVRNRRADSFAHL